MAIWPDAEFAKQMWQELQQFARDQMPEPEARAGMSLGLDFTPVVGGLKGTYESLEADQPGWAAFNAATVPLDLLSFGVAGTAARAGAKSPKIANALERLKNWETLERSLKKVGHRNKRTGQYTGAGPGTDSPQKLGALVNAYARRIQNSIDAGLDPDYFYKAGREAFADISDTTDAHKMIADLMGPTSAKVGPYQNLGFSLQALDQNAMGAPIKTGIYPANVQEKITGILAGDAPWHGYKTERYSNLLGPDIPRHELSMWAPNDQWEGLGIRGVQEPPGGAPQVAFMDEVRRRATDKVNRMRAEQGLPPLTLEQSQALHWAAIRAEPGAPIIGAKDTIQGSLPQYEMQHSWEADPGSLSGIKLTGISDQDYLDAFARVLLDPEGKDRMVRLATDYQSPAIAGGGVWDDAVHPGYQSRSYVAHTQANGLDPAAEARFRLTETLRRFGLGQDAYAGSLVRDSGAGINARSVDLGHPMTTQEAAEALRHGGIPVPTPSGYRLIDSPARPIKKGAPGEKGKAISILDDLKDKGYTSSPLTRGFLDSLDSLGDLPGVGRIAESLESRRLMGEISRVYKDLESKGMLTGSQKLSDALDVFSREGRAGLERLVRNGSAPALVLGIYSLSSADEPDVL